MLFFFLCIGILFSSDRIVRFQHITTAEGLSQNHVYSILQDSKGFMWFGTQDGLNKYDGYTFTTYRSEPGNPNTLSDNHINVIFEDETGMLWIGTDGGGLNRFDPVKETFYRYPIGTADSAHLGNGFVNALCRDPQGSIWIGTMGGGLVKLVRNAHQKTPGQIDESFIHYRNDPDDSPQSSQLSSNFILSLCCDGEGALWIGTRDSGLDRFDPVTGTFHNYPHRSENRQGFLSHNRVNVIHEDTGGNLWIGTAGGGLNVLNKKTGQFSYYRDSERSSINIIHSIYEDKSGVLWVGTVGGIISISPNRESSTSYVSIPDNSFTLSHNTVTAIYEDRSQVLWIGTAGGGINKFNRGNHFALFQRNPNNTNSLSGNLVSAIFEDRFGVLWVGTYGDGLNKFNRKKKEFTHFTRERHPGGITSNYINVIYEDRPGNLWIGTDGGGLNKYNRRTRKFTYYWRFNNRKDGLDDLDIRALYEDRSGTFWVGCYNSGLKKFDRETETFITYKTIKDNPNSISDNCIAVIYEAPTEPGILWIGTLHGGVNRFDPSSGMFRHFRAVPEDSSTLSDDCVTTIYEDRAGTIWIGTYGGGLNKLTRSIGEQGEPQFSFSHYTQHNGLSNNSIYGILEDPKGCLWMSTNNGISRFDPGKETFKNYTVEDGLQGKEFNGGAFHISPSGEMFFGGVSGFNAFFPLRITDNTHIPPVVITGFELMNRPVTIGHHSKLQQSIIFTDQLELSYTENVISFEFAALDFTIPVKNSYSYKLEGFNKDWVSTDAGKRFASYTNLDPGEYVFRVRGSNNDGIWNQSGVSIKIRITPPFWKTWWFWTLVFLFVLVVAILLYRRRLHNVRIQAELRTAHNAQMSIMPQCDPEVHGFDISGTCVPANEVGGDFFDYIWLNNERKKLVIAIGDVSGKAMNSAMTAVMASGMIYLKTDVANSVKDIMNKVNRSLCFKTDKKVFLALCIAALDIKRKAIVFSNAGLNEPLIKSGDCVSRLTGGCRKLALGIQLDTHYLEEKYRLKSGEVVVMFTDGITESENSADEFYGEEALKKLLAGMDTDSLRASEIKEKIITDAKRFAQGVPQHDDMTVVVIKVL